MTAPSTLEPFSPAQAGIKGLPSTVLKHLCLPIILWSALAVAAETTPGPTTAPLRLDGPLVVKTGWDTSNLRAADFDGDGRTDLALAHAGESRILLLHALESGRHPKPSARPISRDRWEAILEDAPFEESTIVIGQTLHALAVGDFTGDGLVDIAYTNDKRQLVIRPQNRDQSWTERREIDVGPVIPSPGTLQAITLDSKSPPALALLTEQQLVIVEPDQTGSNKISRHPLPKGGTHSLQFHDIDADGRKDFIYQSAENDRVAFIRRQTAPNEFGREETFVLQGATRGSLICVPPWKSNPPALARVNDDTSSIELLSLQGDEQLEQSPTLGLTLPPMRKAVPITSLKTDAQAVGNFVGPEAVDVVFADGEGAQVWVLEGGQQTAFHPPVAVPSYGGIADMAVLPPGPGGLSSLLVASRREKLLGVMHPGRSPLFSFPKPLPLSGVPLAVGVASDKNGASAFCIAESDGNKKQRFLMRYPITSGGIGEGSRTDLPNLASRPSRIRPFDINQDGLADLLLYSEDEPLRILRQSQPGVFGLLDDSRSLSGLPTESISPSNVTEFDADGDGIPELLVTRKSLARAVRLAPSGDLEVVAQFNTEGEASLAFLQPIPGKDLGKPSFYAYDTNRNQIVRVTSDSSRILQTQASAEVPVEPGSRPHLTADALHLLGRAELQSFALGTAQLRLKPAANHRTDLDEVVVGHLNLIPARSGEPPLILAFDVSRTRVLEILRPPHTDVGWASLMHFPIFETDPHYRGKSGGSEEPHETLVADVTSDGQPDLVLLVHDRLLVYPTRQ